jgi:urease accessory protein
MLTISQRLTESRAADLQLVLPFDLRNKSRLRTSLADGEEAGLFLERGTVLRGGDLLLADDGRVIEIVAEPETVSTVHALHGDSLARAAYHLGNRHVALQIGAQWLRYQHDHVLDDMVRGLGFSITVEAAAFEPEAGAYGAGAHQHSILLTHGHHHD